MAPGGPNGAGDQSIDSFNRPIFGRIPLRPPGGPRLRPNRFTRLRQLDLHEAEPPRATGETSGMTLEIDDKYERYYLLDKNKGSIDQFVCPVEGCGFQTDQGPGALRMHIVISSDPNCKGRHCKKHEEFVREHPDIVSLQWVHYLAKFPSKLHAETEIGHIKE